MTSNPIHKYGQAPRGPRSGGSLPPLPSGQRVELPIFPAQVGEIRLHPHRRAGCPLHQIIGPMLAAVPIDVVDEPAVQGRERAALDLGWDVRMRRHRCIIELRRTDVADGIALERTVAAAARRAIALQAT